MKKETIKTVLLIAVIYLLLFFLVKTNRQSQVTTEKQSQPVILTDTITNVVYDTVFLVKYKTVKLPTTDTTVYYITDTMTRVDSIEVEVPISKYELDTTFSTDTTKLNIRIQNSGYDITLDTLSYSFTYKPTKISKTKKIHWFIGPSLGIGYDFTSRKLIPTVGIGIIIKRF
jgi:hypothetical protein